MSEIKLRQTQAEVVRVYGVCATVLVVLLTVRPRKPVCQKATLQKLPQVALDVRRYRIQRVCSCETYYLLGNTISGHTFDFS